MGIFCPCTPEFFLTPSCGTLPHHMATPKSERRSERRMPVRVPVSIKASGGKAAQGYTRDLALSGIFLYTDSRILAGSNLEMVLLMPPHMTSGEKRWVCCQATVVRVEDGPEGAFGIAANIKSVASLPVAE